MRGIELTPEHPVERLVDLGVRAETVGFDTLFASSHYNNRDPFVTLAGIAAATDRIRVGPGVANPYETHPVALASRVATLAEVSDDRVVCGLGAGDRSTLRNLGVERDRPLRRVLETMRVARRLWAGERVDHEGTFTARDAALNYDSPDVPVYVGAQGPHMLRMSAKHADGVLVNASHPRDFAWASDQVEIGLDARPEARGPFDYAAYASVSIAQDETAAREAARPPVAFIAGGAAPPVLDRHDVDPSTVEPISEALEAGRFSEAFDAVTPELVDAFCIAGTPETVERKVESVLDFADSFVAGAPLGPSPETAVELLGDVLSDLAVQ